MITNIFHCWESMQTTSFSIYIYIYIYKEKNYRTVRDGGNPTKVAVTTNNIMQVMNIKLK